jgi:hypothetical protein
LLAMLFVRLVGRALRTHIYSFIFAVYIYKVKGKHCETAAFNLRAHAHPTAAATDWRIEAGFRIRNPASIRIADHPGVTGKFTPSIQNRCSYRLATERFRRRISKALHRNASAEARIRGQLPVHHATCVGLEERLASEKPSFRPLPSALPGSGRTPFDENSGSCSIPR